MSVVSDVSGVSGLSGVSGVSGVSVVSGVAVVSGASGDFQEYVLFVLQIDLNSFKLRGECGRDLSFAT